jgi:ketosteroid isomerase-like protein
MMKQTICFFARLSCTVALVLTLGLVCSYNQTALAENAGGSDGGGTAATESAASNANRSEKELMETEDKWLEAGIRGDARAAEQLLAEDYQGMTPTGSVEDKSQFVASVRMGSLRADSFHQDERYVRIFGETAVSTGRLSLKQQDGFTQTRYTRVYVRRQGRWQLFIMQTTRIARQ